MADSGLPIAVANGIARQLPVQGFPFGLVLGEGLSSSWLRSLGVPSFADFSALLERNQYRERTP